MVMASLWYNKSVYMDFRLTACFCSTLCWSSDKLWVLWLTCSYWFGSSTWWFSGPSVVKLFQKVSPPSRYIESRHLTPPENKLFNIQQGQKVSDFPPKSLFSRNPGILHCCFRAYLLSLCICIHVYDTTDCPSSNPVTHLIPWCAVCTVCCLHWLITLPQTLFIYFCTGHKESHQS